MPNRKNISLDLSYGRTIGSKRIPPRAGLTIYGPTVQIEIGVHPALADALRAQNKPVPAPIVGTALIDTGATVTTIDTQVPRDLKLRQSGTVESVGIGGRVKGFTVACAVNIKGLVVTVPRAHCHELTKYTKDLLALIGRDVLQHMILTYNGLAGTISLELPGLSDPPAQSLQWSKKPAKQRSKSRPKNRRR